MFVRISKTFWYRLSRVFRCESLKTACKTTYSGVGIMHKKIELYGQLISETVYQLAVSGPLISEIFYGLELSGRLIWDTVY